MTDAKIIKALECCSHEVYDCDACPLNLKEEELCFIEVRKYALDLINRLQADNELLKENNSLLTEAGQEWQKRYETAKTEAIKEFAERLKERKHECGCNYRKKPVYAVTEDKIDNLVKEMAGDKE